MEDSKKQALRKKAEAFLNDDISVEEFTRDNDVNDILQELRIYQIELKLQNDELRRAQQTSLVAQQKFLDLFRFAPIGYLIVSFDGIIKEVNTTFAQMANRSLMYLTNFPVLRLIDKPYHEKFISYLDLVRNNETLGIKTLEVELSLNNEDNLPVLLSAMKGTQERQIFLAVLDITERKISEKKSIDLAIERERVTLLEQVMQDTSHEIRTPLTLMNIQIAQIERYNDMGLQDKIPPRLDRLVGGVETITDLLDKVRDMVYLNGHNQLDRIRVRLKAVFETILDQMQATLDEKSQSLHFDNQASITHIHVDMYHFSQAIREIIANASKFSAEETHIDVEIIDHNNGIYIIISDEGIGISPEHLEAIFTMFYRVDPARTLRGFGLGLPIANRVIELHGGTMKINSIPEEGTKVILWLPTSDSE